MKECSYEGCTKTALTRDLCVGHYTQLSRGQELRPLGKGAGGHNRKYPDDATCKFEGCTNRPATYWLCSSHKHQLNKYGYMWPITGRRRRRPMPKGFSETMTCDYCDETKNWKKFVLGADSHNIKCRDCHRAGLSEASRGDSEAPKNTKGMNDLMAFLDRQTGV